MSITRSEVIAALDLVQKLRALHLDVMVAGGFCRDVYFTEFPKDLDIIVAVSGNVTMEAVGNALTICGVTNQAFHMYNASTTDRIVGGFKCVGNVDVVLYNVANAHEASEHFDFNLNQFVMLNDEDFDKAYVVYAGDTSWHELVPVREDFSQERFAKMHEKYINLTWRYPEGEGPARVYLKDVPFHEES